MPRQVILLDANVLIPFDPRDTLLKAAEHNLCRVACSEMILAEVRRNFAKVRKAGDAAEKARQADALVDALRDYFRSAYAMIEDYERHIPQMLNDLKDRHVTAAAWKAGRGTIIVTFNMRDFRAEHLVPFHLAAMRPDPFLMRLFRADPDECAAIVREQARQRRRPAMSAGEILDGLATDAPAYAKAVREHMGLLFVPLAEGEVARLRAIPRDENEHIDDLVVRAVQAWIASPRSPAAIPARRPKDATAGVTVEIPDFIVAAARRKSGEQRLLLALADALRRGFPLSPTPEAR
ncbi:MAG: hypothetical protein ACREP1_05165 [Rhodanobacteraceae bacterium]